MARYLLHTTNPDGPTPDELALIGERATIVDRSRRAVLVEADAPQADALAAQLAGWSVQPEAIYPIPSTRRRIGGK